eukprot:scaffold6421_cov251-Ochromonas_danica.AAC.4
MISATLVIFVLFFIGVSALYSAKSPVTQVGENDFDKEVLKYPGIVVVECGHCKALTPEYEKAAKVLKGVAKVVAVDATVHQGLAQRYQVQGFPTVKVFGSDKKKPADYNGQRTSDAIVSEAMRQVNQLVKDRKAGKAKASSEKSEKASGKTEKKEKAKKGGKSAVVELTDNNFDKLVLESNDHWLVEFYAPWCGHCKKLAPEWQEAAERLAPQGVKLGAIDATTQQMLAQKYEIKGFPTIKLFSAGPKGAPVDYNGPREADALVDFALQTLDAADAPVVIQQATSAKVFDEVCGDKNVKICAVLFVPHILDSGAKGRNEYLQIFEEVAKSFRKMPFAFLWSEVGAQEKLENAIELNGNVPTVAVLSVEKKAYAVPKVSWSKKNIHSFLSGVLSGIEKIYPLPAIPQLVKAQAWDGKDGELIVEPPLDDLYKEDEL